MSPILLLLSQWIAPAQACAMPRMITEPVADADSAVKPPTSLTDVFAEIDAAAPVAPTQIQRALNQAKSAVDSIPEVASPPPMALPPKPAT